MANRLQCIKYEFDTTDLADVNFFNADVDITQLAEVDLYGYLILDSMKDNSYKAPNVSEVTQSYYFEANGVQFDLSGAKDYEYMIGFFEIMTNEIKYKWILNQFDENGTLIFTSIISKDNVKMPSVEEKIINVQSTAYELEFRSWFQEKKLFSLTGWTPEFSLNGFYGQPLTSVLTQLFGNDFIQQIVLDSDISEWRVAQRGYFYLPITDFVDSQMDILSGYDSFVYQQLSCFEYLNSLCKCMGWKWFFYLGRLYVKNLYAVQGDIIEIDYNSLGRDGVIETGIENTFLNLKIGNVILDNGSLNGGSSSTVYFPYGSPQVNYFVGGGRNIIFSKDFYTNQSLPREKYVLVNTSASSGKGYAGIFPPSTNLLQYKDDNLNQYRFNNILMEDLNVQPLSNLTVYAQNATLKIETACNTERTMRIDMENTRFNGDGIYNGNFEADVNDSFTSNTDFQYNGNVGAMLYKYEPSISKWVSYQWYVKESEQFVNNFSTYLGSDLLQLFTIRGDGIQYSPLNRYRVINYPYINNLEDKVLSMQFLSFNQFQQSYELKVVVT